MTFLNIWDDAIGNRPAVLALQNNLSATTTPTTSNDTTQGYEPGSVWVDVSTGAPYMCVSAAAGAAVWNLLESSGGAGAFTTLSASNTVSGTGFTARFATPGPIGNTAPNTVAATTFSSTGLSSPASIQVDTGTKVATASAGAATLNKNAGVITSESLTTAQAATYTLTLTNSDIAAADQVMVTVGNGTNTAGLPVLGTVTPAAGSVVIVVQNNAATAVAFNGTLKIAFVVFKN